ncbi:MAG: MATE family efflux transporter [Oscillospiraceae bacterium]|nr:MATE family efflux transporter [Oscillospiraceae bacterium]
MKTDLTSGGITKTLLGFALPMIAGNLLQQIYNIADTLIVGRYLGEDALAAVGSTYTLTTFLYSIIIGLCMGSGALVSYYCGGNVHQKQKNAIFAAFIFIGTVSVIAEIITLCSVRGIIGLLKTPPEIMDMTADYVRIILSGIIFIFLYNYYAYMLRAFGNSVAPLIFLGTASVINIVLDIFFVVYLNFGVKGAAYATLIAQAVSGIGLAAYSLISEQNLRIKISEVHFEKDEIYETLRMSFSASVQQSVMNFGILMIQGLVNSFGTTVMAAFTVAVKIDTLAYMPAQEFGNAFSLFVSRNYGAKKYDRIRKCIKKSFFISAIFCIAVSAAAVIFSDELMKIFVKAEDTDIIRTGAQYLMTEGAFYVGIGILFLLYGYYRGINKPEISLILTVVSLGTRVALAYFLSGFEAVGVFGIWVSIPIGWFLADAAGLIYMKISNKTMFDKIE